MKFSRRGTLAALIGVALLAAACGSDDSDDSAATTSTTAGSAGQSTTTGAATTGGTAAKAPASMEEWEALWAKERDAIVKRIKDNKWGLQPDGKTVLGARGLQDRPLEVPGRLEQHRGHQRHRHRDRQPHAVLGDVGRRRQHQQGPRPSCSTTTPTKGYFKDSLGKTRKITLVSKDDGYDPARDPSRSSTSSWTPTRSSPSGALGSPSVHEDLRQDQPALRRPILFAVTGHPAWGDPVNHPWTTGILFAYNTEAVLWGSFIDTHFDELKGDDGKVTFAALVMNNDFGESYDSGFQAYLAQSPNKDRINYVNETIEPSAPTVKDPMTNLAAENPEHVRGDDRRYVLFPGDHRGGGERHAGEGQVPVDAVGLQAVVTGGAGRGRRPLRRLVDHGRRQPGHQLPGRGRQPVHRLGPRPPAPGRLRPEVVGQPRLGDLHRLELGADDRHRRRARRRADPGEHGRPRPAPWR